MTFPIDPETGEPQFIAPEQEPPPRPDDLDPGPEPEGPVEAANTAEIREAIDAALDAVDAWGPDGTRLPGALWLCQAVTASGNVVGSPHIVRAADEFAARDAAYEAGPPIHAAVVQVSVFRLADPYHHAAFTVTPQAPKWGGKKVWKATV